MNNKVYLNEVKTIRTKIDPSDEEMGWGHPMIHVEISIPDMTIEYSDTNKNSNEFTIK